MRYSFTSLCFVLSVMLSSVATAEDDGDRQDRRAEMRQRILDEFDADGDGEMSDEERATAREEMRKRRGSRGEGKGSKARKGNKGAKGERGRRNAGQGREGRGRRGGPGGPPDPGALFDKFDANGDGQLSRAEFMKLTEEVRSNRQRRGPGPGDRDRADARPRRPEGPPPPRGRETEARRPRFERERPLSNPDDRRGPPSRPVGRRLNDEDGPDRRESGPRGGAERRRPPSPDAVFDRFDENNDNQLSRDEFMKLAERMRQMHERRGGPGGGPGGDRPGMRDGRGPRRGPAGEDDGPPRRPRRPRPESDASTDFPVTDESTA